MKTCPHCGAMIPDDNARFCLACGSETTGPAAPKSPAPTGATLRKSAKPESEEAPLVGDKNLINESTIIGKQEKYEASNITIHNNITEDHSRMTVVCAVSGKHVYIDHSVVCPDCGKQVALEYYVEPSKRCERCEEEARKAYREAAARITAEGPLDAARKARLDAEAGRLRIDGPTQTAVLRSLQQTVPAAKGGTLSPVQQAELDASVKQLIESDDRDEGVRALEALGVLHGVTDNYTVDYWYFLARAILEPEASVKSYEEEVTDNYWQRYWGFLGYCNTNSPKASVAVDRVRSAFGEREDDLRLAEAAYFLGRGFEAFDRTMLERAGQFAEEIRREYLSRPLQPVYDALRQLVDEGIDLDRSYSREQAFIFLHVFRAGRYIARLQTERQERERLAREEQERKARAEREARERQERQAREERERQERERAAAEEARRKRQAELAADRSKRMEQEMARLGGKPAAPAAPAKEFAGYDTTVLPEKRRGGWKRTLLIVLIVVVVILIALFLIPAPESLQ